MIRFTWMQFRVQAALAFGSLTVIAVLVMVTGPHLAHLYDTTMANCKTQGDCGLAKVEFVQNDSFLQSALSDVLLVVPALMGIFWGAPLIAREIETGTFRLVWTQSVTRSRWLFIKFAIVTLASVATAGLLTLMVTWWFSPIDSSNMNSFTPGVFDERGIVAIGFAALALALGVTAGLLIRRTLPAMALALAAFVSSRLVVANWIRPYLISPVKRSFGLSLGNTDFISSSGGAPTFVPHPTALQNAWIYSSQIVDKLGHPMSQSFVARVCPVLFSNGSSGSNGPGSTSTATSAPGAHAALQACFAKIGATYHDVVVYQPASRYWAFQWYETALLVELAIVLGYFSFWWLRRYFS